MTGSGVPAAGICALTVDLKKGKKGVLVLIL
jgi:hypothetical protein